MNETKKKAKEIMSKYQFLIKEDMTNYNVFGRYSEKAKQCALKCVDEIIERVKELDPNDSSYYYMGEQKFWQQVKEEINKL